MFLFWKTLAEMREGVRGRGQKTDRAVFQGHRVTGYRTVGKAALAGGLWKT
jgi:hypothetical protein